MNKMLLAVLLAEIVLIQSFAHAVTLAKRSPQIASASAVGAGIASSLQIIDVAAQGSGVQSSFNINGFVYDDVVAANVDLTTPAIFAGGVVAQELVYGTADGDSVDISVVSIDTQEGFGEVEVVDFDG